MDHDPGVGQGVPLARGARRQQDGPHRRGLADAIRRHIAGDELHRIVDRQARRHAAAGRVDVQMDVGLGIFGLQKQ